MTFRKTSLEKKNSLRLPIILAGMLILIAAVIVSVRWFTSDRYQDYRRIAKEEYDTVFLSMFPVSTYPLESFSYYRGMTVLRTDGAISDGSALNQYMKRIARSGNVISCAYLGIRPDQVTAEELRNILEKYPSVTFEIIVSYPSCRYWQDLEDAECEKILDSYCSFLEQCPEFSNGNVYFYSSLEWFICNPGTYEEDLLLSNEAAEFVLTHSDILHEYQVTSENASSITKDFRNLVNDLRSTPAPYPDLSDIALVFFGDSVIGNYTDAFSIPGVVKELTGAAVYNCGYGGNSAAITANCPIFLPGIVDAFFAGDLSVLPQDIQVYQGVASYLSDPPAGKKLYFVINYGLNDYFEQCPISGSDPLDPATYAGALRLAVEKIRTNSPDAEIILCSPTFTTWFQNRLNAPVTERGKRLEDYADAVTALAEELNVLALDNYHTLGINRKNQGTYLSDMIHPNEACRYKIACNLIELLAPGEQ